MRYSGVMLGLGNHNREIILERKALSSVIWSELQFTKLISVAIERMNCSAIWMKAERLNVEARVWFKVEAVGDREKWIGLRSEEVNNARGYRKKSTNLKVIVIGLCPELYDCG